MNQLVDGNDDFQSKIDALMGFSSISPQDLQLLGKMGLLKNEDRVQFESLYRLGKVYYDKSDLEKADLYFAKAIKLAELPRDMFAMFKLLGFLVRLASERQDNVSAEQYIKQSEELLIKMSEGLPSLNAEYFYNEGVVRRYKGQFIEGRESFILACKKAKEENSPDILAKSLYGLASSYLQSKDHPSALSYLDQLNELLKILQKTYLAATMHLLYANVYTEMGEYQKALSSYILARQSMVDKACWNLYAYGLMGEGVIYKKMGELNRALVYFDLAMQSVNKNYFRRLHQIVLSEISDVQDNSVDLYLDRTNRVIYERDQGAIDFKHRFVLLEILFLLAQNPGVYYDKEQLVAAIWKDEYNPLIHDKLIYTSVSRLRKLIEPDESKRKYILRGKDGYALNPHIVIRFHKENDLKIRESIGNIDLTAPV